ncbi:uncharacterized protein LOC18448907 [Amborella trichopoda]|uniref:Protein kinase domain-containing protein n=1 Tax=Amborella trichopoda TaxID=13333 RepID=U5D4F8_AMBTC|nr:uncharacterized protein LOC18448907 [Amborella trichopoda]ERN20491.1 hypothetical protein AMTR_s00068p00170750 [Amborella trichopoda]|eukprot:XP_006859024.1 uncharacterized protein LOC18448907 [Amborella trichopoda]
MVEENSSWVRRVKYSNTVCHRFDASRFASLPILRPDYPIIKPDPFLGQFTKEPATSKPISQPSEKKDSKRILQPSEKKDKDIKHKQPLNSKIKFDFGQNKHNWKNNKTRSLSPIPQSILSDAFKEAKHEKKVRSSTPGPRRNSLDKSHSNWFSPKISDSLSPFNSPLQSWSPIKNNEKKSKNRKENSWAKYFDHGGGRVTAVETAQEWMVDLSKLFLGLRFASGAHSRLYHGIYKDQPVAVKVIRQPDDDENGVLAARLEKQFNREVTLLSHLYHRNVIQVIGSLLNGILNVGYSIRSLILCLPLICCLDKAVG